MKKVFVYVASPYTKGDVAVNTRVNIEAGDKLAVLGFVPFIPLLTHFWHMLFPHPYQFWTAIDLHWIDKCDALLRLPGESSGADAEVAYARERNIPVFFSIEALQAAYPEVLP